MPVASSVRPITPASRIRVREAGQTRMPYSDGTAYSGGISGVG